MKAEAAQTLSLNPLFSDGMVLQSGGSGALVFGEAAPGETVTVAEVSIGEITAVATAEGRWRVELEPRPASQEPTRPPCAEEKELALPPLALDWCTCVAARGGAFGL